MRLPALAAAVIMILSAVSNHEVSAQPSPGAASPTTGADSSDPNFMTPAAKQTDDTYRPFDHSTMTPEEADRHGDFISGLINEKLNREAGQVTAEYYGIEQKTLPIWAWLLFGVIALVSAANHAQREKESYAAALNNVFTSKLFRWPDGVWDFVFKASGLLGLITSALQIMQWTGLIARF